MGKKLAAEVEAKRRVKVGAGVKTRVRAEVAARAGRREREGRGAEVRVEAGAGVGVKMRRTRDVANVKARPSVLVRAGKQKVTKNNLDLGRDQNQRKRRKRPENQVLKRKLRVKVKRWMGNWTLMNRQSQGLHLVLGQGQGPGPDQRADLNLVPGLNRFPKPKHVQSPVRLLALRQDQCHALDPGHAQNLKSPLYSFSMKTLTDLFSGRSVVCSTTNNTNHRH